MIELNYAGQVKRADKDDALVGISEASKLLGVSEKTLRIWDKTGKLPAAKTDGGHRRYDPAAIREFLKKDDIPTTLNDEFAKADLRHNNNLSDKMVEFWEAKGFLNDAGNKDGKKSLAILLSNQMEMNNITTTDSPLDDEHVTQILVKMWSVLAARELVYVGSMLQPITYTYYMGFRPDITDSSQMTGKDINLVITNHAIEAKTRRMNFVPILPFSETEEEAVFLDPKTFEPRKVEGKKFRHHHGGVDQEWINTWNAKQYAAEIDNEVIDDLWNCAREIDAPMGEFIWKALPENMMNPTADWLVANEFGLEILKKCEYFKLKDDFRPGVLTEQCGAIGRKKVFYNQNVKGILKGSRPDNDMSCGYQYHFYVPITCTPKVIDQETKLVRTGLITRYSKTLVPNGQRNYNRITL